MNVLTHDGDVRAVRWSRGRPRRAARMFDEHGTSVHVFATVLAQNAAHAELLVREAFARQLARSEAGAGVEAFSLQLLAAAAFSAWCCGIAWPRPLLAVDAKPTMTAMQRLPDDHRATLALCRFGDHTHRQAAAVMGVSTPAVDALLREAMLSLGQLSQVSAAGRPAG